MRKKGSSMKGVYLILALILLPATLSLDMKGGDIYLFRPDSPYIDQAYVPAEYLSVEDLVFYTCIEEKGIPVKSSVICLDDNSFTDVEVVRWLDAENCYMGTYDLSTKDCRRMVIQSEYMKDKEVVTLTRDVKVNRLSSVLDLVTRNQYSDGGWKNAVETAGGLWVLSNYPEIYDDEIALGMDWLKQYRDNDEKCWPKDDCSVYTTAKILAYLSLAGFNDSYRIMHDGRVFLQERQNFYQGNETWNLSMAPFESGTTNCLISYGDTIINDQNFSLAYGSSIIFNMTPYPTAELVVICDQNIVANLSTGMNDLAFAYEGDNLSYHIPNNCWSLDYKWGACDLQTSIFATITNISEDNRALALDYLATEVYPEKGGEEYVGTNASVESAALYSYLVQDPGVVSWLRYHQNNNGSWGNGTQFDDVIPTGYALLGLLANGFNRTDEVIEDAERWVNDRELEFVLNVTADYQAWNATEKNALAYIVLRNNNRPLIKSSPELIMVDRDSLEVELYNPTTFKLEEVTFAFSDNLKDILAIEAQDYIPPYSYISQTITKKGAESGNVFGSLSVFNHDVEIGRIPVMITNFPTIAITATSDPLLVFGTSAKADFSVSKTSHTFSCTLVWDDKDITSKSDFTVSGNTLSVDLVFTAAERVDKTYTGTFTCTAADSTFSLPVSYHISRYSAFPFAVAPPDLAVNSSTDVSFFVENKLDETIDVTLRFLKNSDYFELSRTSVSIDPNSKVNVTVQNLAPAGSNVSVTNAIEVSALGQKKEVTFRATIVAVPEKRISPWMLWGLLVIIVAAIGTAAYFAYTYRDLILGFVKKGSKVDQIKVKIKKLEEREKRTAILNMIRILRILKKDDLQIRTRLKQEGFTDKEIDDTLAEESQGEHGGDVEAGLYSKK
jgi:hypothetical protein